MQSIEAQNRAQAGITSPPKHVAVIMDGNGRWATQKGLPRVEGHRAGSKTVRAIVERTRELGIPYLTLYAFSAQNWQRPELEVNHLMALLVEFCYGERQLMIDKEIRLHVIGQRERLPAGTRQAVEAVELATASNDKMHLIVAVSYGGREEIVQAVQRIATAVTTSGLRIDAISEQTVSNALWTSEFPDPDVVLRTSGELRVSNFLLWQIAYAEMVVSDRMWPDFTKDDFDEALRTYQSRQRRYGGVEAVVV